MKHIKKYIVHILCTIVAIVGLSSCVATRPIDTIYYETYPHTYIVVPNGTYRPPVRSTYYKPHVVRRPPHTPSAHHHKGNNRNYNNHNRGKR